MRIVAAQLAAQAQKQQQQQADKAGVPLNGTTRGAVHTQLPDLDRDFVVSSLDLVSGLAEGLGPAVQGLVVASNLRAMVVQCCQVGPDLACLQCAHLCAIRSFCCFGQDKCVHVPFSVCAHMCMWACLCCITYPLPGIWVDRLSSA